jgi:glycosyltransferase involved in cell wall biosynthesis
MNEVRSLNETLDVIRRENVSRDIEFLIVLSPRAEEAAADNARQREREDPQSVRVIVQSLPKLGGALIDAFSAASGRWIVMMASDLETDPHAVRQLIEASRDNPDCIVATTRWQGEGAGFDGYNGPKQLANRAFQSGIGLLYRTDLTDLTYGFRLYPRAALQGQTWRLVDHGFLLESLLRPMKAGWRVIEIPVMWTSRTEGVSNNSWRFYASYFKIAASIRFGAS